MPTMHAMVGSHANSKERTVAGARLATSTGTGYERMAGRGSAQEVRLAIADGLPLDVPGGTCLRGFRAC